MYPCPLCWVPSSQVKQTGGVYGAVVRARHTGCFMWGISVNSVTLTTALYGTPCCLFTCVMDKNGGSSERGNTCLNYTNNEPKNVGLESTSPGFKW